VKGGGGDSLLLRRQVPAQHCPRPGRERNYLEANGGGGGFVIEVGDGGPVVGGDEWVVGIDCDHS